MKTLLNPIFYYLPLVVLITGCKKETETPVESSGYQYSTLPVSDTAIVPEPVVGIGIESGNYSVGWYECPQALSYEVEEHIDSGEWELVYSGGNRTYRVGAVSSGVQYAFRVRAVYETVVSNWSNPVTFP